MCTKFESKWTCLTVQSCSNLKKDRSGFERVSWGYIALHDMRLGKIIKHVICDRLEFSWIFIKIFPVEIFQILEMGRNGFGRFCPIFNHLHVLRLTYMENICPYSLPKFSQIFLKH